MILSFFISSPHQRLPLARLCMRHSIWQLSSEVLPPRLHAATLKSSCPDYCPRPLDGMSAQQMKPQKGIKNNRLSIKF